MPLPNISDPSDIDVALDTTKTPYKPNSGKVVVTSKAPDRCVGCLKLKEKGDPPLSVCAGCKVVKYCSRECQKNHWKAHKIFCTHGQKQQKQAASLGIDPNIITSVIDGISDFVSMHQPTIIQSLATATFTFKGGPPLDFRKTYVVFTLGKNPRGDTGEADINNPSMTFSCGPCQFFTSDVPHPNMPMSETKHMFEALRPKMDDLDFVERNNPDYLGLLLVVYQFAIYPWVSPLALYKHQINRSIQPKDWYNFMKYWIESGTVFRRIQVVGKTKYRPGVIEHGGKSGWVWKPRPITGTAEFPPLS